MDPSPGARHAQAAKAADALLTPRPPTEIRAARGLRDDVRRARGALSAAPTATIRDVTLTRDRLDTLARPTLDRTIAATTALLAAAPAAVLMIGGAARTPLAASLPHRALGIPPMMPPDPELTIITTLQRYEGPPFTGPTGSAAPAVTEPPGTEHVHTPTGAGRRRAVIAGAAVAAVVVAAALLVPGSGGDPEDTGVTLPTGPAAADLTPAPTPAVTATASARPAPGSRTSSVAAAPTPSATGATIETGPFAVPSKLW